MLRHSSNPYSLTVCSQMLFPFYGVGLREITLIYQQQMHRLTERRVRGSLCESLIYLWHHHVMFEEDWGEKEMKL